MDQGRLVPDSVVIGLVRDKIGRGSIAQKDSFWTAFPVLFHRQKNWNRSCGRPNGHLDRVVNFQGPA